MALLSLIAASFYNSTRTEIKLAYNQAEVARAEALADAGVHAAVLGLLTDSPSLQWRADGTVYGWRFGGGEIRVEIRDEGGKIDLNAAPDTLLTALFVAAGQSRGEASTLVDRIVDYRDTNDLHQLNGAEDNDYLKAGLPYDAKDAPFEAVEELHQVLGMTAALYDLVAPALTVYSRQPEPFEPTAPPLVRAALGGAVADAGDEPAPPVAVEPEASQPPREPPVAGALLPEDEGESTTRSLINILSIHAEAQMASGSVFVRQAVVEVGTATELPFQVWSWQQGRRLLFPLASSAAADPAKP